MNVAAAPSSMLGLPDHRLVVTATAMRSRVATTKSAGLARTLLMLALACAVLVGLLAMHTISSTPGDHMGTVSTMSAHTGHPQSHGATVTPGHAETQAACGGMCDPGHVMAEMACVLALLVSALAFAITASRRWSTFLAALRSQWLAIVAVASVAMPPPPDLRALSISRT
jgi:hypothetical protein